MNKSYIEEKKYLGDTLERFKEIIEDTEFRLDALPRMYGNNPMLLESLLREFTKRLELMKKTQKKPYFARIDFTSDDLKKEEECYIGKVGVFDEDNNLVTVDWRAPIASMYYDSNIGEASYKAPEGVIKGKLTLKRQYEIENGELKDFQDVDTVSNDDFLKPYLGASADNRLKNIVATIQAEQNAIIRDDISNNIIIQGVAGSGKTTVALHRVAYLVYNNMKNIKPEQYLVIGPNKFFVNYISGVLPDLDVDDVNQLTYDEIIKDLLGIEFILISDKDKLIKSITNPEQLFYQKLKVSMAFKNMLDKFISKFDETIVPTINFEIKGYEILDSKFIRDIYEDLEKEVLDYSIISKKIERAILITERYIKEHKQEILSRINEEFYKKIKSMNGDDAVKERKKIDAIEKEINNGCHQSLKKYFSGGSPKIISLYIEFLKNINLYLDTNKYNIKEEIKENISNLKSKKIEFEDLAAIMYLYYRIFGSKNYENYKQVVVDEAQDFGEFNFLALKKLMPKATFSIFGDLAQSIYEYRGISDWDRVIETTFEGDCSIKYLKKSYRTTTEIMNSANNLTEYLKFSTAEPVIRHGIDVNYIDFNDNQMLVISEILKSYIKKGYSSIAVICKDSEEAKLISLNLEKLGIKVTNITDSDTKYDGGICTITSYLAKGLEFDAVVISDATERVYDSNKKIDMKLLYVAMTRALHELNVLYNKELVKPLVGDLKKNSDEYSKILRK